MIGTVSMRAGSNVLFFSMKKKIIVIPEEKV